MYWIRFNSSPNRNEYLLGSVRLTALPPIHVDIRKTLAASTSWKPSGSVQPCTCIYIHTKSYDNKPQVFLTSVLRVLPFCLEAHFVTISWTYFIFFVNDISVKKSTISQEMWITVFWVSKLWRCTTVLWEMFEVEITRNILLKNCD